MLKDIVHGEYVTTVSYELCFDDGANNGFGFPCDADGKVFDDLSEAAWENYGYCLNHPEQFNRYNTVVKYRHTHKEPDSGTCRCGERVFLQDEYYGACRCPKCGQWYNLFGQELVDPEYWDDDPSETEFW